MKIRLSNQHGATAIEYVIIIGLMAILVITNFDALEAAIGGTATSSATAVDKVKTPVAVVAAATVAND